VVDGLRAKGAVFVEELDEVPDDALVVFSAHGVPKAIPTEARRRNLLYADATCPLVSKVHRGVEQHHRRGRTVLLIGHSGHPEVVGTMGQLPKGAVILVETVAQAESLRVPDDALVVFSAHGVPKEVPAEAQRRQLIYADATCPLVSKVHRGVEQHAKSGRTVLLIGHSGHPEVVGTMGQLPPGAIILVQDVVQAESLEVPDPERVAYATQTTLSIRETEDILAALKRRFPSIAGPRRDDICYATTNRQRAVEAIAPTADLTLIIGSPNSSNSVRLVEVARAAGCPRAALVQSAAEMDWDLLAGVATVAVSAGASAPEELVDELIAACRQRFTLSLREIEVVKVDVSFRTPPLPQTSASADRRARLMPASS
jgi:4-hydroxy-3-methylbut-2-enyl diphosphate reductase